MSFWGSAIIILVMILCSKFLRSLAFGRSDSIALEVCICALMYCLITSLIHSPDLNCFFHEDLMRCLVLFAFALVVAAIHKHNKDLCLAHIDQLVNLRRVALKYCRRLNGISTSGLEEAVLNNTVLLARASIDVWYSQFMDKLFYKILKRTDKDPKRSFRKKKTLVRWAFADLLNNLIIEECGKINLDVSETLDDKSLNIPGKDQIISMVIFDIMAALAIMVALRII